jgi:glycosyltransferase involved in cell wall biosynthesis
MIAIKLQFLKFQIYIRNKLNMKIGIVTDSIRKNSTGIGIYSKDIVNRLIKTDKKNDYFFIDYLETDFNNEDIMEIKNPFKYFKTYSWHSYMPYKTRDLKANYIINFSAVPHFVPFRQREIFFVYDISWYLYPEYHPKTRVLFYKTFFKRTLENSYKIVTDSNSAKEDLIKYFSVAENKISVIYPSVPSIAGTDQKNNVKIKEPFLLFIGTLEPRKNIESIINAFKILKDKHNIKHKLVLCGKKGWLYDTIFELIKKLNLESEVEYFGYISDTEKKYLLQNAECFVFPSNYEGFGIPVIEAISYCCPVITSNVSSLPEAVGNAGLQVNPKNVDEIVHAIEKVLFDKKIRSQLVHEGKNQLKLISNKKQIEDLVKLINE